LADASPAAQEIRTLTRVLVSRTIRTSFRHRAVGEILNLAGRQVLVAFPD